MHTRFHNRCALQCVVLIIAAFTLAACNPRHVVNIGTAIHRRSPQAMCVAKYGDHVDSYVNVHGDVVCEYVKP